MNSTKEYTLYQQPSHTVHAQQSSCFMYSQNSSITKQRQAPPRELIIQNLGRKYGNCHKQFENMKVVNDLIYNEHTQTVSIFKDYLILDDINEFLKRFYDVEHDCKVRLPKLCEFYEKYSQVFPNFIKLPESKYMFANIQRKQRLIDEVYNRGLKAIDKNKRANSTPTKISFMSSANRLFTTDYIESVLNQKSCQALPSDDEWHVNCT